MPQSVPLSVRISSNDAEFLAQYEAPGATTPSEKLRAILASARQHHEGTRDFATCVALVQELLRPAKDRVRSAQRTTGTRSEFLMRLYDRLPEIVAELVAIAPDSTQDAEVLKRLEARLADHVFALIEEILDMALTSKSRTFDPALIQDRISPLLEILNFVNMSMERKGASR